MQALYKTETFYRSIVWKRQTAQPENGLMSVCLTIGRLKIHLRGSNDVILVLKVFRLNRRFINDKKKRSGQ